MTMHVIEEGFRNLVIRFYGAGANTVDVSELIPPCEDLRILKIYYDAPSGVSSSIEGIATVNEDLFNLTGHGETYCFNSFGGIVNNAGAGKTGDILVTVGDAVTSIVVWFKKVRTSSTFQLPSGNFLIDSNGDILVDSNGDFLTV